MTNLGDSQDVKAHQPIDCFILKGVDWLWLLHPAFAVVLIYPLIGMVVRLGWQTRQRRVSKVKHPPVVGRDHSDLGRWLTAAVVLLVLIALAVAIATKVPLAMFAGGPPRALLLILAWLGSLASLIALLFSKAALLRLGFSLITWVGVLSLGAQPEVWRLSDQPFSAAFWQSHYWGGVAVTGLMLFSLGARAEILKDLRLRRLHITASLLASVLFVMQAITGTRDLLEIPLSWQKPVIQSCNFQTQTCPANTPKRS